jgi:two-component system, sensor histidine kinase and response regulator
MTELLLESKLTPEQHENLSVVKASADSLLQVINDILDFSHIEARKLRLEHIEFNLRDCIARTEKGPGYRGRAEILASDERG